MWYRAENPGGLSATDKLLYSAKMYFDGALSGSSRGVILASFEPAYIGVGELNNANAAVAGSHEGPQLAFVGVDATTFEVQLRSTASGGVRYRATNFKPTANNWYEFAMLVDPASNTCSVWYKDLYAINVLGAADVWEQLLFDAGATLKLALSAAARTTLFNGWQIAGVRTAQFDDVNVQLYPYLTTSYTLSSAMQGVVP
jgi:hypothetical protein